MRTSTATPTRERPGATARGFTLLELAMTIALVALAATMVAPRLAARDDTTLELAAKDAAQRLAAARWRAVVEGHAVRVSLDTLAPGFRVTDPDAGEGVASPLVFDPLPAALPRTVVLANAAGAIAHITIPSGLAPLAVTIGDAS